MIKRNQEPFPQDIQPKFLQQDGLYDYIRPDMKPRLSPSVFQLTNSKNEMQRFRKGPKAPRSGLLTSHAKPAFVSKCVELQRPQRKVCLTSGLQNLNEINRNRWALISHQNQINIIPLPGSPIDSSIVGHYSSPLATHA